MLFRKITKYIEDFYKNSRNTLLLTGARQTGKTYSIRNYGKNFKNFIEINFIERPDLIDVFKNVTSAEDIILRLTTFFPNNIEDGETLIFFDEVQKCDNIVTAIKFLVDDGRYRYIMSGSLLGVELNDISSQPVGYMGIKEVYPLDFEEFIINMGVNEKIIEKIKEYWNRKTAVDDIIHQKLMQLFRLYLVVGGMPAAVNEYVMSNNLGNVITVQKDIVSLYRKDISQYAEKEKLKIKEIFDLVPSELDAKNKRFILKNLNEHVKYLRYQDSFLWLKDAGVVIPVYNLKEPKEPLKLSETRNLFKLFSNDVGLLSAQYSEGIQLKILSDSSNVNIGAVYENAVAQELYAHEFIPYYYNNKKRGEIDFVISVEGEVLPIEVKSGKDYQRHSALTNILNDYSSEIKRAIVLNNENMQVVSNIIYAPIYMIMFIKPAASIPGIYRIDLTALS